MCWAREREETRKGLILNPDRGPSGWFAHRNRAFTNVASAL